MTNEKPQCRPGAHAQLIDESPDVRFTTAQAPGRKRYEYPMRIRACENCGWMEWYLDVKKREEAK